MAVCCDSCENKSNYVYWNLNKIESKILPNATKYKLTK